jgi:hypothetical protein
MNHHVKNHDLCVLFPSVDLPTSVHCLVIPRDILPIMINLPYQKHDSNTRCPSRGYGKLLAGGIWDDSSCLSCEMSGLFASRHKTRWLVEVMRGTNQSGCFMPAWGIDDDGERMHWNTILTKAKPSKLAFGQPLDTNGPSVSQQWHNWWV